MKTRGCFQMIRMITPGGTPPAGGGGTMVLIRGIWVLSAPWRSPRLLWPLLAAVCLAGTATRVLAAAQEAKAPVYTALAVQAPMRIDGVLTPEEWAGADPAKAMVLVAGDARARAWAVHTGRSLVIGVEVGEGATRDEGSEWGRCDGVQVALAGIGQAERTWVLRGYPGGKFTWGRLTGAGTEPEPQPAKGVVFRARAREGGGWTAECRIPFQSLGIRGMGRQPVALHLTVRRAAEDRWLTWPANAGPTLAMGKAGILDWPEVNRWEETILAFEARDRQSAPPKGALLFVGSSSIVGWDVARFFPDLVTINRGFGGSQLADSVHYFDRIVLPHQPKVVVLYAGDNDIPSGKSPEVVAADFEQFLARVKRDLPGTHLVYIATKPSISRWALRDQYQKANALIREQCEREPLASYLDIWPAMLGEDGTPRPELYKADGLHLSEAGYQIWTTLLRNHLKEQTTFIP
jgi:lysophospholipase L1-like esterase